MIDKVTRVGLLYDFYGELLTAHQRQVLEMYYFDDWSLSEVAEAVGVSRQAVHDNVKRSEEQLEHYESILHLYDSNEGTKAAVKDLLAAWNRARQFVSREAAIEVETALQVLRQRFE
ncbi:YlxM family DNA-binding protein [Alicyclobacillus sp. SO9]|uniref:YlxM family DNA-binding protein n=1 Tax=Alicyclobacillus sp. SO9 TaxID=2665646 RepID=UPI0018E81187|nr:YlxM family DNA-binding protein [Alicyclobacillus sp. SO9]QQE80767.1 YlxM family DNA-binding protein [Alicyclobacillus sp. SO9]